MNLFILFAILSPSPLERGWGEAIKMASFNEQSKSLKNDLIFVVLQI
jgi:hypothetical protein